MTFATDAQIARRLGIPMEVWNRKMLDWERDGMPKPDHDMGKRWAPTVEKWFDGQHQLTKRGTSIPQGGGPEVEKWPNPRRPVSRGEPASAAESTSTRNVYRIGRPPRGPGDTGPAPSGSTRR